ncbi:sugar ABC transporter substrate-binding protein [Spongisporangium articulatum]|uniref:Sugar ABC transporter substrate-binding protein n=1 Tax=Spongisporangium articulatum TaxID=3362603 RepID=A0ABW8AKS6_9ACTN
MNSAKKWQVLPVAATAALVLALAACGGSSSGSSGGDTASTGKVGVILPDATTSPRWEANDRPSLTKAFSDAGIESDIQNAGGDKTKFATLCDSMINEGVQVLMIVNLDSDSGAACLKKAAAAGIKSIDYDRLTLGGGASYYVSFDNVKVGGLMGEGLEKCLADDGKTSNAGVVYINGAPTDNNAALFKQGYDDYLKGLGGKVKLLSTNQTGEWDAKKAGTAFDGLYSQFGSKIQGVISANDTMAGGIIASLKRNGLAGKVPVTGQDASVEGLQRILAGTQCMTVYKNTNLEADAASKLAIALIKGDTATADSLATGSVPDTVTKQNVKSVLVTPQAIYQDSVKTVVSDGFQKAADICTTASLKEACTKYGVS